MKDCPADPPVPRTNAGALVNGGAIFSPAAIDAGRILAASVIFCFHIGWFPFAPYGEFAVEYFIILSGITYLLFSKSKPATPAACVDYLKHRLAALFPAFLLVNLAIYLGSFCYPSMLGRPYAFAEFLASATGTSMYFGWKYMSTVMWFMPFIVQVYLLLPLLDWAARRLNPVVLVLTAFGLSCWLAQMVSAFVSPDFAPRLICKNWSPVFRLPEVCVGIILGRMALGHGRGAGLLAVAAFGLLSLLVGWLQPLSLFPAHLYMPWAGFLVPALLFIGAALLSPLTGLLNVRWIRLLGLASFSFYLLHAAPVLAISHRFPHQPVVWMVYFVLCWATAISLTLFIARVRNLLAGARRI
jgi:peptidoglycan/LPS O-acetylase OafA/YrhL